MTTDIESLTFINGLAVDEDGVIVEKPQGADAIEVVMESIVLCQRNQKGWEQREALLRKALEKHMSREGLRRVDTKWGRAIQIDPTVSEFGKPEEVPAVVKDYELDPAHELAIYMTAKTLDARELRKIGLADEMLVRLLGQRVRAGHLRLDPPAGALEVLAGGD